MTIEAIEQLFKSHAMDDDKHQRSLWVRNSGLAFAHCLLENVPDGADRSAAIRKIREAVFTANAAIAMEEKKSSIGAAPAEVYA